MESDKVGKEGGVPGMSCKQKRASSQESRSGFLQAGLSARAALVKEKTEHAESFGGCRLVESLPSPRSSPASSAVASSWLLEQLEGILVVPDSMAQQAAVVVKDGVSNSGGRLD